MSLFVCYLLCIINIVPLYMHAMDYPPKIKVEDCLPSIKKSYLAKKFAYTKKRSNENTEQSTFNDEDRSSVKRKLNFDPTDMAWLTTGSISNTSNNK